MNIIIEQQKKYDRLNSNIKNMEPCQCLEKSKELLESIFKKSFDGKILNKEKIIKCKQKKEYKPTHILLIIGEE